MSRASLAGVSAVIAVTAAFSAIGIMALLPGSDVIAGWSVITDADRKGSTAADFFSMYDGAAPQMRQAGLVAAGQRTYQQGRKRLTVDLLRFNSWQQARAYYLARRNEIDTCPGYAIVPGVRQQAAIARSGRTTVCYLWGKQYCGSLSVNAASAKDTAALRDFAAAIGKKVAALP